MFAFPSGLDFYETLGLEDDQREIVYSIQKLNYNLITADI